MYKRQGLVTPARGKFYNCSLLSTHATTETSEGTVKDQLYWALEKCFDDCPHVDIKIIIGDCNAQVGKEQIIVPTIGKYRFHNESNGNRQRLINFAVSKGTSEEYTIFSQENSPGYWEI